MARVYRTPDADTLYLGYCGPSLPISGSEGTAGSHGTFCDCPEGYASVCVDGADVVSCDTTAASAAGSCTFSVKLVSTLSNRRMSQLSVKGRKVIII